MGSKEIKTQVEKNKERLATSPIFLTEGKRSADIALE